MRQKEFRAAIKAFQKASKKIDDIKEKYSKKVVDELEYVGRHVIDEWYDSYPERSYDPIGSLYDAYKINIKDGRGSIDFSPSLIDDYKHHQDNSIIYNNVFLEGYHGGSTGKGLKSSIPHWRKPPGIYSQWYSTPAPRSFSPYKRIHNEMYITIKRITKEVDTEFDDIEKKLTPHINRMKGV